MFSLELHFNLLSFQDFHFVPGCSLFTHQLFLLLPSCPNVHVHEFARILGLFGDFLGAKYLNCR